MRTNKLIFTVIVPPIFAAGVILYVAGCQSSGTEPATTKPAVAEAGSFERMMEEPQKKAGSELWAENCTRCHNARPPNYYSDATWDIIAHHMRLRANLTGEETRQIAVFLKAGN